MIAQFGPLQFSLAPFNAHAVDHQAATDFASHDVIGRRAVLEHMGDGAETIKTSGRLLPLHLGGRDGLALAQALRTAGAPHVLVWGNGEVMGWCVITDISARSEHLAPDGTGRVIEVDITFKRADSPSPADYFSALYGLTG